MSNIVLTGFMGTGKTTIGGLLAERLDRPFIDTDDYITTKAGMTVPQIFAEQGEPAFRQMEAEAAQALARLTDHVISTGGGMLINPANRQALEATGFVVCLTARPEVIAERLAESDGRPLATDWQRLYDERLSAYAAIAHHVDTSDLSPDAITEQIITLWRAYT